MGEGVQDKTRIYTDGGCIKIRDHPASPVHDNDARTYFTLQAADGVWLRSGVVVRGCPHCLTPHTRTDGGVHSE